MTLVASPLSFLFSLFSKDRRSEIGFFPFSGQKTRIVLSFLDLPFSPTDSTLRISEKIRGYHLFPFQAPPFLLAEEIRCELRSALLSLSVNLVQKVPCAPLIKVSQRK